MKPSVRKYIKVFINLGLALLILLLFIFIVPRLLVFFMPFIVGWVISLIARPLVRFFEEKMKIRRKTGSAVVIIVVIALVVFVGYLIGAKLAREFVGFITELPELWGSMEKDIRSIGENLNVLFAKFPVNVRNTIYGIGDAASEYMATLVGKIGSPTIEALGKFAKQVPSVVIATIMCLLSAYFFVAEKNQISTWMENHMAESLKLRYHMKRSLTRAVGGYFKAQFKIELWIYLLLVIGLTILGVDYTLLIALGIAFMDLLPFLGTGTIMVPWAIVKLLSSDYKMALGLLIIWGVGQLVRQIIQPKIVGDSIGVPAIPTLFLLFIGFKIGGVIGMILAVPIGIILATMYQEGAFDTTVNSLKILVSGVNRFRSLSNEDMRGIVPHRPQVPEERTDIEK